MQEAALDQQWEMTLLRAQLQDAEDALRARDGAKARSEEADEGGEQTPSSLLSLRRVNLRVQPGELVAVVGAVGSGKVSGPFCVTIGPWAAASVVDHSGLLHPWLGFTLLFVATLCPLDPSSSPL